MVIDLIRNKDQSILGKDLKITPKPMGLNIQPIRATNKEDLQKNIKEEEILPKPRISNAAFTGFQRLL